MTDHVTLAGRRWTPKGRYEPWLVRDLTDLSQAPMSDDEFFARRREVLARWPTGREIEDLDGCIAYARSLGPRRFSAWCYLNAEEKEKPSVQTGSGESTIEKQYLDYRLTEEAGAGHLSLITDTYTRRCRYEEAQKMLERAEATGEDLLNGFPLVNYGAGAVRRGLVERLTLPIGATTAHTESPLLGCEIGLATGIDTGGTGFVELIEHSRDYPPEQKIKDGQYRYRLVAKYNEAGVYAGLLSSTNLTGYAIPAVSLSLAIMEMMLAAAQGVRYVGLYVNLRNHLVQDVAAQRVARRLLPEYLARIGCPDAVVTSIGSWAYEGEWPRQQEKAWSLVAWTAITACLAGADWMKLKTPAEALNVPAAELKAATIRMACYLRTILRGQRLPISDDLLEEEAMIELGTRAIIDRTLELGDGDLARGMIRAVEAGVIDVPFSPWVYLGNRTLVARDAQGAQRLVDPGHLPLPEKVLAYERGRMRERTSRDAITDDLELVMEDVHYFAGIP